MHSELTKGELLVGLTFNPSGSKDVIAIKEAAAALIDAIGNAAIETNENGIAEGFIDEAIKLAVSAQMFGVKAATWSTN